MTRSFAFYLLFVLSLADALLAQADDRTAARFASGHTFVEGVRYDYRLLEPLPEHREQSQPLLVYLHGAGERGDDNRRQLHWLPKDLAQPAWQQRWPCFVLAVQCPREQQWVDASWREATGPAMTEQPTLALRAVQQVVEELVARADVDGGRVYLTGMSMGGLGAWELAMRHPDTYAAVLPVCGGGDPRSVRRLVGVPIETWHGAEDGVITVERSRELVEALRALGFAPRYHEVEGVGHDVWKHAYSEDGGLDWLFAQGLRQQARGVFAEPAVVPRPDTVERRPGRFQLQPNARVHVAPEARAIVSYLLDVLEWTGATRPFEVSDARPAAGDLVFAFEEAAPFLWSIDVGEQVTLLARDALGMRRGCAALAQLLQTWPAHTAPRGLLVQSANQRHVRVELASTAFRWSSDALQRLHVELFLAGVDELAIDGTGRLPASDRDWLVFQAQAKVLGVELRRQDVSGDDAAERFGLVAAERDSIEAVLRRNVRTGDGDGPLRCRLRLRGEAPDALLLRLRLLLPAIVERACRPRRPVHLQGFVSRVAPRWR